MKRGLWITLIAVFVAALGVAVVALRPQRRWTTNSVAAAAAFEQGLQADLRFYHNEAVEQYERALELDPDFVVVKVYLAVAQGSIDKERSKALLKEAEAADLQALNSKEQFRVRYYLARRQGRDSEANRVREEYLAREPNDAFAVFTRCTELWAMGDWSEAEACNRQVLEIDPNWSSAYNFLGYIAMAQERFEEAEKHFRAYRYIAPDQANPHDSLGELLTLLGRWEEAEEKFNEALSARPDFCASYSHLLTVKLLQGDSAGAQEVATRAQEGGLCDDWYMGQIGCTLAVLGGLLEANWEAVWQTAGTGCLRGGELATVFIHRAAVMSGRLAEARAFEEKIGKYVGHSPDSPQPGGKFLKATLEHMQGVRLMVEGDAQGAVPLFRAADVKAVFRGEWQSFFKLYNRLALADALKAAGNHREAEDTLASINAINPRLVERLAAARVVPAGQSGLVAVLDQRLLARSY